jgi:hypothetical protein
VRRGRRRPPLPPRSGAEIGGCSVTLMVPLETRKPFGNQAKTA